MSRNNLAAGYAGMGRNEEAVRLGEETLPALERVLGPDHPYTLQSRRNLAIGYRALDRHEDADRVEGKKPATAKPKRKRRRKGGKKGS